MQPLCGDRACRVREMQARVRLVSSARNPLRRSCVSSAPNAGESAIRPVCAQPSAEIVRVECAKCRQECDIVRCARNPLRRSRASSARNAGESAMRPVRAQPSAETVRVECAKCRHWRLSSTTLVRGASGELEDENLGSWKMRTGDFVVQL